MSSERSNSYLQISYQAHDAQWTGYGHIAFQTVADKATAGCGVYVPIVCCALFASWVRRGISLSVSCLTVSGPETEAKDVIQENTDKQERKLCLQVQ